ncbi:MAG: methyltransferase domain-containing protein [Planctomycetaceae bacterium]|nr:methyltransferase domain-containing protein [Planctomycetaceae bacterium]
MNTEHELSGDDSCLNCHKAEEDLSAAAWQQRYQNGQTGWDRGAPGPQLMTWLTDGTLSPCRILVPGCGRGHEVVALAAAGFDVTAVDFAEEPIHSVSTQLQERDLKARVIRADVFAFDPDEPFDAVYEQTCLCAIHPSQWRTYEQQLACWLRPSGKLFALFLQADNSTGPPFGCHPERMRALFSADVWEWPDALHRVEHPTGLHELAAVLVRH